LQIIFRVVAVALVVKVLYRLELIVDQVVMARHPAFPVPRLHMLAAVGAVLEPILLGLEVLVVLVVVVTALKTVMGLPVQPI
jgi:hypothetical protein